MEIYGIPVCSCFLFFACQKEKLPKPTQEGKGTFGCEVDGKIFLAQKSNSLFAVDPVYVDNSQMNGFIVSGTQNNGASALSYIVSIATPYLTQTGTYELATYPYGEYKEDAAGGARYHTDPSHTGTVTITHCDLTNKIFSGTFSFTAIDDSTGKVVHITKGRFDAKWHR